MAKSEKTSKMQHVGYGPFGWAAFVAFIGAFVYFAQGAKDFVGYFNAFFEAVVWPGILVFHVLKMLGA